MPNEPSYKHQVLLNGGQYDDSDDTVEGWLNFLTDPNNLQPGLPSLTIAIGEWNIYFVHVTFDQTKPSLSSIKIELTFYDDSEVSIFRDSNPPDVTPGNTSSIINPHHLKNWVFRIFEQTEMVSLEIPFLTPELPDLFDKLPKLNYVSFKKSGLLKLPASFYKLPELHSLDFVGLAFPELPSELASLPSLKRLLFDQPFSPGVLGSLTRLTHLQCHGKDLEIPPEFRQLTNLESLYLPSVASAPDDLLNFSNLKWLHLTLGKFTHLRFAKGSMPALTEFTTNSIGIFSTALGGFKNLKILTASGGIYPNDVEPLKASFAQLVKLNRLSLNRLDFYPIKKGSVSNDLDLFSSLPSLEYLNLNDNGLNVMPRLAGLYNLKELHLRRNWISEFRELPANLEYIDLGKNGFISIHADLSYLKNVRTLLLNNNKIERLGLLPPNLEILDLDENGIAEIPSGFSYLLHLKSLSLNGNKLAGVPQLPVNLVSIDLGKNAITQVPLGLNKLQRLKILKLNKNPITDFPEQLNMPGLERLEFIDTKLPERDDCVMPTEEVLEKMKRIFPNAILCFDSIQLK